MRQSANSSFSTASLWYQLCKRRPTIHDAITGMPIACGATVTLSGWEAPYLDGENCHDNMAIQPQLGAGDFEIVITKPGYHDWSEEISVKALNHCGTLTEPEIVEAFLSPIP